MVWNRLTTRISAIAMALILSVIIPSCTIHYGFNTGSLDYTKYKTIQIAEFPIRAALVYPPLQQIFENQLIDYITRSTRLQVTESNPSVSLEGEITGYNLTPQAVTEDAYASKTRLTITVRVKYTDNTDGGSRNNVDQSFSAYRDFDASQMLTDVQDELCQQITDELVTLIYNATLGNW